MWNALDAVEIIEQLPTCPEKRTAIKHLRNFEGGIGMPKGQLRDAFCQLERLKSRCPELTESADAAITQIQQDQVWRS